MKKEHLHLYQGKPEVYYDKVVHTYSYLKCKCGKTLRWIENEGGYIEENNIVIK